MLKGHPPFGGFNPRLPLTFSRFLTCERGSTDGKQTSKGLFICTHPFYRMMNFCFYQRSFLALYVQLRDDILRALAISFAEAAYALISTSTPEGKSNLLKASTVLDEEV